MQTLLKKVESLPIKSLCQKQQIGDGLTRQFYIYRLAYEIETQPQIALSTVFRTRNRDSSIIKEALVVAKKGDFLNENLVKEIRIAQTNNIIRVPTSLKVRLGVVMFAGMGLTSFAIQLYYYLEYDFWLTSPSVSDYHLYRFK